MNRNDILHSINNVVYGPSNVISIINNVGIKMFVFVYNPFSQLLAKM